MRNTDLKISKLNHHGSIKFRVNFGLHSGGKRWFSTETEAKAAMKLADLEAHTRPLENASGLSSDLSAADKEMARKRAIIEAAMAKAKARQKV